MTKALIFGVNGQDGSYLAEFLLSQGCQVVGWAPASIPVTFENVQHLLERITLVRGDLLDQTSLEACLEEHRPDQVYNLASPSSVPASWEAPVAFGEVVALGVARLLEAIRRVQPSARFFQASSSELFGIPRQAPQDEHTPFQPRNPYGNAKLYAHWAVVNYRERYGLFAASGILFNHESPRRPPAFVTRKITQAAAAIRAGRANELRLGNLQARRDWGFAGDYVEAMARMLDHAAAEDFVIGSGETHSVSDFLDEAFGYLDLDWHDYVVVDPQFFRPLEAHTLQANPAKARRLLGWGPRVSFQQLVRMMVEADLEH